MMSLALQSLSCLESSVVVCRGLAVVATAPMATTAKKATGKWMELGDKMRTTSLWEMLRLRRAWERVET